MKQQTKTKLIEYFLAHIELNARGLTEWEVNFINSIKEQWNKNHTLSEAQYEKLEKIYAERT